MKKHAFITALAAVLVLALLSAAWGRSPLSEKLKSYMEGEGSTSLLSIEAFPRNLLPEGIMGLHILLYPLESPQPVLLGRYRDGSYCELGILPFKGTLNRAKTDANYDEKDGLVYIASQMPFSAMCYIAGYSWSREKECLVRVSEEAKDPSRDALIKVDYLLSRGDIAQAGQVLGDIMYPGNYYRPEEMAVKFLKSAHRHAVRQFREGSNNSWKLIAESLKSLGEITGDWAFQFQGQDDYDRSGYAEFLPFGDYITAINDYGFLMEQAGKAGEAVKILTYVVKIAPDRIPAHLNLADALYKSNRKNEAAPEYRQYVELMKKEGKASMIPARAYARQ